MKAIKGVCWLLVLGVLALPALAAPVNMQFTGLPTGANYWGVASYPYNISVNGGANQWMMCIGYYEHIEGGETWQANVASVGSLDPATHLVYYQAAYLFKMAAADGGVDSNINAATWYLLEGAPSLTPEAAALVALAQNQSTPWASSMTFSCIRPFRGPRAGIWGQRRIFWQLHRSRVPSCCSAQA